MKQNGKNNVDVFNQLLQLQGFYEIDDLKKRRVCFENGISSI